MTTAEKIAAMQTKRTPIADVWQTSEGTWAHRHDAAGGFADRETALIDLRFSREWYRGRA